jgi:DNA-binding CsgD family transcriptional regulator/tetratricopeptide (TPR) repeat protein
VGRALREELARTAPCVCVLEDCHWADEATLDALAHVARRSGRTGAVLLVTFRDDELSADHRLRAVIGSIPREDLVRVPLEPLSRGAVGELAGGDVDVDALYGATGGNPFLVTEALAGGAAGAPPTVREAVLARAARLSRAARGVLELVSIVPARAELRLVEAHAGAGAAAAVEECEGRGLLVVEEHAVRFRHELARRAYRESLSALRRIELNRAALRILEQQGEDPARLVHHAEAAQDHEALVRHGLVAAQRAAGARSHREAVELYSRVLRHEALIAPAERAAALEALSAEAYTDVHRELALPAQQRALALRRELGDPRATGANLRWLSRLYWWVGRRREAEAAATEAVAVLEALPPGRELALAYSNQSQLLTLAQHAPEAIAIGERAMELALELGDEATYLHAQTNVGTARMLDDADAGRALLLDAGGRALAADLDEHACRAFHNVASMDCDYRRFARARAEIDDALAVARRLEHWWFEADTIVLGALHALGVGAWNDAVAAVEELLDRAELPAVSRAPAVRVLATVELRRGGPQVAGELVEEAWELARPIEELQLVRPAAALRAEAAWLAGDVAGIAAATGEAWALALEAGHEWDLGELAVWRRRGGVAEPAPARCAEPYALSLAGDWEAAARAWEEVGEPYERALALCDAPAPEPLLAALELLDGLGAGATAGLVRRRLKALGVRGVPRGPRPLTRANPAGLTARQVEVLGLVAAGCSNAEIARRLFLTPKTVEHHVTAILRKLRAGTRAGAVDAARELGVI